MGGQPVRLVVDDDLRRSRLTVFFRLLLAIPHLVWLLLWTIAAVVVGIVAWVAALVRGRLPDGLHAFLGSYVRYGVHVGSYLSLVANPFPGFTGGPGYPVDVSIPPPERQARRTIAVRLLLAIPALVLAAVLGGGLAPGATQGRGNGRWAAGSGIGGVTAVCGILGWFASLARGRMPHGLRDLGAYGIGYGAQAWAYAFLLTDRYPSSDPEAVGPVWALPPHPVALRIEDDGRRSRLTTAFRLLLALPHLVWLTLWTVAAFLAALLNGIVALVGGRSAEPLHRFLTAYIRYAAHVTAFLFLVANPFPGFAGTPGYPLDVELAPAARQSRWITLFRTVLVLPALLVSGALTGALAVLGLLGWFASLATGRMPHGMRNLGAIAIRYLAQTNAYWLVVTDAYPYSGPALQPPAEAES